MPTARLPRALLPLQTVATSLCPPDERAGRSVVGDGRFTLSREGAARRGAASVPGRQEEPDAVALHRGGELAQVGLGGRREPVALMPGEHRRRSRGQVPLGRPLPDLVLVAGDRTARCVLVAAVVRLPREV